MDWHGQVGEIREVLRDENGLCFEWKIPKIFSMPEKVGGIYFSPKIKFLETDWHFGIFKSDDLEWIGLELWRSCRTLTKSVRFTVGLTKADSTEEQIFHSQKYPEISRFYVVRKFLHRDYLLKQKSHLAPSDALTVSCTLWRDEPFSEEGESTTSQESIADDLETASIAEEVYNLLSSTAKMPVSRETQTENASEAVERQEECTHLGAEGKTLVSRETQTEDVSNSRPSKQDFDKEGKASHSRETQTEGTSASVEELARLDIEGISILRKHFSDLLLSGDDHDVTIKVKDQEFKAHKNVLRVRSPVFAAMFKYKMKENTDGSVSIDDCDPESFGEFLQYVYTGMVQDKSPNKAIGLYYAGDKYDFPRLKAISIEVLKTSLSSTMICNIITLAIRYNEEDLLDRAMTFFSEHLEEILSTKEWESFIVDNPMLGNKLLLKALKGLLHKN